MTVYELVKEKGFELSHKELNQIGNLVAAVANEAMVGSTKVSEKQPTGEYMVNNYMPYFKDKMEDILVDFMLSKK